MEPQYIQIPTESFGKLMGLIHQLMGAYGINLLGRPEFVAEAWKIIRSVQNEIIVETNMSTASTSDEQHENLIKPSIDLPEKSTIESEKKESIASKFFRKKK